MSAVARLKQNYFAFTVYVLALSAALSGLILLISKSIDNESFYAPARALAPMWILGALTFGASCFIPLLLRTGRQRSLGIIGAVLTLFACGFFVWSLIINAFRTNVGWVGVVQWSTLAILTAGIVVTASGGNSDAL